MNGSLRSRISILLVLTLALGAVLPVAAVSAKGGVSGQGVTAQIALFDEDKFEPDDTTQTAMVYNPAVHGNTFSSKRTFHGVNNVEEDESDWLKISITETGTPVWVETMYLAGWADTYLRLYDENMTLLANVDDHDYFDSTYSESMWFRPTLPGIYYLEIENISGHPFEYELHVTLGNARRISGPNRFATAAAIARLQWDNTENSWYGTGYGPNVIVVANGHSPADMSAGAALATSMGGILLMTHRDSLPWETKAELTRITESRFWDDDEVELFVVGGKGAVSEYVFSKLQRIRGVTSVERLSGPDRFHTALAIADEMASRLGTQTAYVVNGQAWPDALSASPVAGWDGSPVLMTGRDSVPTATVEWLRDKGITDVLVVGGKGVVSDAALDQLNTEFGATRITGIDRFETSKNVALHGVNLGMNESLATLVSGNAFADGFAAASFAHWTGAPILLTPSGLLHPEVKAYFDEGGNVGHNTWGSDGIGCYVIGGTGVIGNSVYEQFRDLWKAFPIP